MKYLDEYRDDRIARKVVDEIRRSVTQPWVIMEVCGGQTHSIVKYGLDYLLPKEIELVHGPGCPVCVTPLEMIDRAHAIARRPDVIFCSFGDMLRVPGSDGDLFQLRAAGANVKIVYSPMDCLRIARRPPGNESGVLRHRFRNNGAGQCNGGIPGQSTRSAKLFAAGFARDRAPGHDRDPAVAG